MKSTCKDNIWMGWRVYNLNVPLDVDPKCIFIVQFYYRVCFLFVFKSALMLMIIFSLVLGVGAVTACLKLHEVFPHPPYSLHPFPPLNPPFFLFFRSTSAFIFSFSLGFG